MTATNPQLTLTETDATLVTASDPSDLSTLEAAIMDACNTLHEARAAGDRETAASVRAHLNILLDRYDATDGDDHPNPAWARPNQRALALSAAGETEPAIRMEMTALKYADTPRRREISLGNIADRLVRLGRVGEALEFFLDAADEAPESVPVMVTGAQALHGAGMMSEADAIFAAMLDRPELLTEQSELAAYLDYERRLHDMAEDLPSLAALLDQREMTRAQFRSSSSEGGAL